MRKLMVFNHVSLDGLFVDRNGQMTWAKGGASEDAEWTAFVAENASGDATLVFGRKTYELMSSYWPTPMAAQHKPKVAEPMNALPKVVFSRTLDSAEWQNTRLVKGDLVAEARKMKSETGPDMVILGSGSIVSQLAAAGLVDEYQMVVNPIVLGKGRTLFETVGQNLALKMTNSRVFRNGNTFLCYAPVSSI